MSDKDPNHIERLIQQVEDALVNDSPDQAAQALAELAACWANAGLTYQSFLDMRQHLIQSAGERTSAYFVHEKLKIAETKLKEQRHDRSKNNTLTSGQATKIIIH